MQYLTEMVLRAHINEKFSLKAKSRIFNFEDRAGDMSPEAGHFGAFQGSMRHFLGKWPVQRHFSI